MLLTAKGPLHLGMTHSRLLISFSLLLVLFFLLQANWGRGQGEVLVTSPLPTNSPAANRTKTLQGDVLETSPLHDAKPQLFHERRRNIRSANIQEFLTTKDIKNWPWWKRQSIIHWQGGTCGTRSWECGVEWLGGFLPGSAICAYGQIPSECTALPNWLSEEEYQKRLDTTVHTTSSTSTIILVTYPKMDNTIHSDEIQWPRPSHLSDLAKYCLKNLFFEVLNFSYEQTIEWKTDETVEIEVYRATPDGLEPTKSVIKIRGFSSGVDMMAKPGICSIPGGRGPYCYLVTQLVNDQIYTQRMCSLTGKFTCINCIKMINNLTCAIFQYTPSYVNSSIV
nr:uncharacterized protein LOC106732311 [Pelodiscus sinensis]|eukprot:XP_014431176.1 uncharacterized protein LOC106732311 [Pelodiscus sinensis]